MDLSRAELQALAAAALPGGMMAGLPNFRPHDLDVFASPSSLWLTLPLMLQF